MKYAVIKIQGKQQKIEEGKTILVDRVSNEIKPQVLLLVTDDKVQVGTPTVVGVEVKFKKVEDSKGEKIYVRKYKAKSRYRKKTGYRHSYTKLLVEKIS